MRDCKAFPSNFRLPIEVMCRLNAFLAFLPCRAGAHIHKHTQCQMVIDLRPSTIRSISPARGRPAFTNPCQSWETTAMERDNPHATFAERSRLRCSKPPYTYDERETRLACTRMHV